MSELSPLKYEFNKERFEEVRADSKGPDEEKLDNFKEIVDRIGKEEFYAVEVVSQIPVESGYKSPHSFLNKMIGKNVLEGDQLTEMEFLLRKNLKKGDVHPLAAELSAIDAEEVFEDLYDNFREVFELKNKSNKKVAEAAARLSCDRNSCCLLVDSSDLSLEEMRHVRNYTGIRQILDPVKRVDAATDFVIEYMQSKIEEGEGSYSPYSDFTESRKAFIGNQDNIRELAKEILNKVETPSGRATKIEAGGAVYLAAQITGCGIIQKDITEAIGTSPPPTRNSYKRLGESIKSKPEFLKILYKDHVENGECPEGAFRDVLSLSREDFKQP